MRTSTGYIFAVADGWLRFRQRTTHTGTHVDMDVVIDPYDATFSSVPVLVGRIGKTAIERGWNATAVEVSRTVQIRHANGAPISHNWKPKEKHD